VSVPRVLMVVGAYYPELSGGALQIRQLVRALGDRVDARVLTTTAMRASAPSVVDDVPVHRVYVRAGRPASMARAGVGLARTFLRLAPRIDIVQLAGFSRKSVLLMALATALRKVRVIKLTSVGDDDPPAIRARGRVAFAAYRRADMFVGVSPRQQALCAAAGFRRFTLIPNGVDTDRFRPPEAGERERLRRELGLPAAVPLTLFVGFFSREKQPHVLYEAWRRLPAADAGGLVFIGATRAGYHEIDPALAPQIRDDARRAGVADRLYFVERSDEIEKYYRAADIFALPSLREGMPNALLEAMATGLPCVVSRLPGVTEWIVDDARSGLLVAPGEVSALSEALGSLLRDRAAASKLGETARAAVAERFGVASMARAYAELYQTLLRAR
jgi:glycosyltransferase involved in cell wall biosynthesis